MLLKNHGLKTKQLWSKSKTPLKRYVKSTQHYKLAGAVNVNTILNPQHLIVNLPLWKGLTSYTLSLYTPSTVNTVLFYQTIHLLKMYSLRAQYSHIRCNQTKLYQHKLLQLL